MARIKTTDGIELHCEEALYDRLAPLGAELRFIFINSDTRILRAQPGQIAGGEIEGLSIRVMPSTQPKCIRCWQHRADVGQNAEHPDICGRCVDNVAGDGEVRHLG